MSGSLGEEPQQSDIGGVGQRGSSATVGQQRGGRAGIRPLAVFTTLEGLSEKHFDTWPRGLLDFSVWAGGWGGVKWPLLLLLIPPGVRGQRASHTGSIWTSAGSHLSNLTPELIQSIMVVVAVPVPVARAEVGRSGRWKPCVCVCMDLNASTLIVAASGDSAV